MTTLDGIARIIHPSAWAQYDLAAAPYIEKRGSKGEENYWYQKTWNAGCRSVQDVRAFWLHADYPCLELDMFYFRISLKKAEHIIGKYISR